MDMVVELQRKRQLEEDQDTTVQFGGLKIQPERIERFLKRREERQNKVLPVTGMLVYLVILETL